MRIPGRAGRWVLLLAGLLAGRPAAAQVGEVRVHDPVIAKQGDVYYVFGTGPGVSILRSTDLVHWERAGRVFDRPPAWVASAVPEARGFWAPDISRFAGRYHLYYAVSSFGSQRSAIGLATNVTLDPSSPDYRWEDRGMVVESVPGVSTFNAIDPNVALDEAGDPWLSWGSFWGGIKMRRLDPATGKLSPRDTTLYSLAARQGVDVTTGANDAQAIEAPFVVRHGGYYWLFVSFDLCCRGAESTYNIRVGRAPAITGPYVDRAGVPMTGGGGTLVLGGEGRIRGPGHNAVYSEGGRDYLVHHYYDAEDRYRSKLQIRPLTWSADGWPVAGAPLALPAPPE
jgi:arabinan endo-1,5-alpha-L-arabinosidase